ncbi:DUF4258 domain-containing protein [Aphanothece sacrum]|uniref:DUF4258 domain-containing protein n=1 Tax=Aphanothece sacrum FPU1 TaxID=1920663 RepID=A0A401IKG3_APHSA|nr:DUF4258 domain-containing protein [Aphanothece sacrum]GBF81788.1 hypothetical protein AsFPU1_3209 [Aphanothece sacrum FPU1]GBF84320.1 hypothetical protein AsFPU3_1369 [Aphanothece sacrum FPU3]
MEIVWTHHAEERQKQWQSKLGITREEVENVLNNPQQIIIENEVFVAQAKKGNGLLRIVFVNIGNSKRILTLYWTNQINRYWQENNYES